MPAGPISNFRLGEETTKLLKAIAADQDCSFTQAMRSAVRLYARRLKISIPKGEEDAPGGGEGEDA